MRFFIFIKQQFFSRIRKCSLTIDASGSDIMKGNKLGDKVAAAAKSSSKEKSARRETRQGGSGGQQQPTSEIMKGDKAWETRQQRQPRAAQNGDHEGRQAWKTSRQRAAKSSPEWRSWRETNEGRWRETRRQRQPRAGQNGDREGGHMKGDKAAAASIQPFWGSATQSFRSKNPYSFQLSGERRETNEGRSSQEQARMEILQGDKWRQGQPRAGQNGDHAGRHMKAGAAKSRPEWRSCRETNGGRGSQEQARMEITKGDKWRETNAAKSRPEWRSRRGTNEGRQMKAGAAKSRPEWRSRRETNEGRQMKAGAAKSRPEWRSRRETNEGRQMKAGAAKSRPEWRSQRGTTKGDKWRETRWQRQSFGDQQPNLWEVRTPIASSYLGKNQKQSPKSP